MNDCEQIIEQLYDDADRHGRLASLAEFEPVAAMHAELADFSLEQAHVAEDICADVTEGLG